MCVMIMESPLSIVYKWNSWRVIGLVYTKNVVERAEHPVNVYGQKNQQCILWHKNDARDSAQQADYRS